MQKLYAEGFLPVCDKDSRVLILGSFPSVKSREIGFYYGNPQNRFWKTICGFFSEEIPATVEGKREFLKRCGIALWDVVLSCRIEGSKDGSIENEIVADIPALLKESRIKRILCNGTKSFSLLCEKFPSLAGQATLLPSTSPANPRFCEQVWIDALREIFPEVTK